mmetsp:Transcript_88153/g.273132  ORF Transcript_88153/g.273132 Transcript_88153/m.273132 type:complete len:290 (-) Transcript_88153:171-1040(-)
MQTRGELPHVPEPQIRDLLPLLPASLPDRLEVVRADVILGDCDAVLDVQHAVPPVSGHEDDVPGLLDPLVDADLRVGLLQARQEEVEVHDGLVVLALVDDILGLGHAPRSAGLEEDPPLAPVRHGIPRRRPQRIGVHRRPGALRPYAEPSVGRPGLVVHQAKPVMREDRGDLEVVQHMPHAGVLVERRLEEIQRAVVPLVPHVVGKVLELHAEGLAVVVLPDFEIDVPEALLEGGDGPALHREPVTGSTLNDDGSILGCVLLVEPLGVNVTAPHAGDGHRLRVVNDRAL